VLSLDIGLVVATTLDMAEEIVKEFIFTISLLGATIQDGGIRERSNLRVHIVILLYKF